MIVSFEEQYRSQKIISIICVGLVGQISKKSYYTKKPGTYSSEKTKEKLKPKTGALPKW